MSPAMIQTLAFAGRSIAEKLVELRIKLRQEKADGIVVTALDEVFHSSYLFTYIQ